MILNEYYFGKNPILEECESVLATLILRVNRNEDIIKQEKHLNRLLSNLFNSVVDVRFTHETADKTYTFPVSLTISNILHIKPQIKSNKYGVCYDGNKNDYIMIIRISVNLIKAMNFTPKELLAVILHEVGHNFYMNTTPLRIFSFMNVVDILLSIITRFPYISLNEIFMIPFILTGIGRRASIKLNDKINENILKNPSLLKITNFMNTISDFINDIVIGTKQLEGGLNFAIGFISILIKLPVILFIKLITFELPIKYFNEKFADNFPTMYGYGPDLMSALQKMEQNTYSWGLNNIANSSTDFKFIIQLLTNYPRIITHIIDEHPSSESRIKDQYNMLKSELNKTDLPIEAKKMIEDDLKKAEAQIEERKRMKEKNKLQSLLQFTDIRDNIFKNIDYDHKQIEIALQNRIENYTKFKTYKMEK